MKSEQHKKDSYYIGNEKILNNRKIGFLCSRKVPAEIILETYDWAIEQRDNGVCVVSGFHSKIEKDVFHYLLKGEQPLIMILARGLKKRLSEEIKKALNQNRLLIIAPFPENVKRVTEKTAEKRNKYILEISDEVYTPYVAPKGNLAKLLDGKFII